MDNVTDRNNEPQVIFKLNPNSYALITMDLRHLKEQTVNWVYGEDWAVSITASKTLTLEDPSDPIQMPELFLNQKTSKSQVIEFSILSWADIYMRIDVLIYNALYINHKYTFQNSTSVEIRKPNRARYGTEEIFAASLREEYMIMLPFNQPPLQPKHYEKPETLISFAQERPPSEFSSLMHKTTKNRNLWIPSSLYWNQKPQINIAYLPYFSNCNGYGEYIPLWALLEQNNKCE